MKRYEYKIIDTGKHVEEQLNGLGARGWQVVGVTTKKQLLIAPPQASDEARETPSLLHARVETVSLSSTSPGRHSVGSTVAAG